jgi:hypothetical protein
VPIGRSGCLFVHIPKCAGTAVEVALGVAEEYPDIGLKKTVTRPHIASLFGGGMQHLTIREIRRNFSDLSAQSSWSFSIVRDPVDRFISHVLWKHHRFAESPLDDAIAIKMLSTEAEQLVALSRGLDLFQWPFEGLEYCEGDAQTLHINDAGRHLLPQCAFIFDHGVVPLDAIYPIEEIDSLERDLHQRAAITTPIPFRMVGAKSDSLRQMIPAGVIEAIQNVYRFDMRLHEHVRKTCIDTGRGYCSGASIDQEKLAGGIVNPISSRAEKPIFDETFPRQLWMYWHQGWNNAPPLVQKCAESWLKRNPSWKVHYSTAESLHEFVTIPEFYFKRLSLPLPALSDVIRIHLLSKYGGVWADASTWSVQPLDQWLPQALMSSGFFAYALPAPDRPISTWLIAAFPAHPIVERLKAAVDNLWAQVAAGSIILNVTEDPNSPDYFWFHRIFAKLLETDEVMADLWQKTPQIKASAPHYLQDVGLLSPLTADAEFHIRNILTNVYKLTRRVELSRDIEGTVLGALFKAGENETA